MNLLGLTGRLKGGISNRPLRPEQVHSAHRLLVSLELDCEDLFIGDLGTLLEALLDDFLIAGHHGYAFQPWHLKFKIHVTWSGYEPSIG